MIRVLNIVPALNYCGGIENYAMNYYRYIDRDKIQFDFITHTDLECSFESEIENLGGNVFKFPKFSLRNLKMLYFMIDNFFSEHNEYKIIHCHMANAAFLYFYIAKKHNIHVRIIHSHNTKYADKLSHAIRNVFLDKIGIYFANYRMACTKEAGDFLFGHSEYSVIRNAIEVDKYEYDSTIRAAMRKKYGLTDNFIIGHVGRFVPQKNHRFMIRLIRELIKLNNKYMICFVGEGELYNTIIKESEDIKDNIIYAGTQYNVHDYYNMFDAFMLPSIYEGLGIVNIEAQCSGLPLVVSEAVPRDICVTDNVSFLPLSVDKWVNKIIDIKENYHRETDNKVRNSRYDIKSEVKKLENVYRECVDE